MQTNNTTSFVLFIIILSTFMVIVRASLLQYLRNESEFE